MRDDPSCLRPAPWNRRLLPAFLLASGLWAGNCGQVFAQAAPEFTSPLSVTGTAGSPFSYQIAATNLPNSYSVSGTLPTGVFLTGSSSGLVSGTPTSTGTFALGMAASNLARFSTPSGIAEDGNGNIYVADTDRNTIRKITPEGEVSTFAGVAGRSGTDDGTGSAARFNYPFGLAVDGNGNLFVADQYNHTIRKITPEGVVTTIAGTPGVSGATDGYASSAKFYYPIGLAIDGNGNVYVADQFNYTIRKISAEGWVSTIAGSPGVSGTANGTGTQAQFGCPTGVAIDGSGNLYVADQYNNAIRKVTSSGVVSTLAGSPKLSGSTDGVGSSARFYYPTGLVWDGNGALFVADKYSGAIRKVLPDGTVSTFAAGLVSPVGIAQDGSGNLLVADSCTVKNITPSGTVSVIAGVGVSGTADGFGISSGGATSASLVITIVPLPTPEIASSLVATGSQGGAFSYQIVASNSPKSFSATGLPSGLSVDPATGLISGTTTAKGTFSVSLSAENASGASSWFYYPNGVAVDGNGSLYVADSGNHVIRKIASSGAVTTLAGAAGVIGSSDGIGSQARFNNPYGIAVDGNGNVYVGDYGNNTIRKISPAGAVSTLAGTPMYGQFADGTGSAARFKSPYGVAVDGSGNVYVADQYNHVIRKITAAGVVTTLAGSPGVSGTSNGTGSAARFNCPTGVAVDGDGNVYVAEWINNTIRKITPQGVVTTLAGSPGVTGTADGVGSAAQFDYPYYVAVDGNGNLFVTEYVSSLIRKITAQGVVSTFAGSLWGGTNDGLGTSAGFDHPLGVAVDANGNVYVADQFNDTIRKITASGVVSTIAGVAKVAGSADSGGGTGSATLALTILGPVDGWRLQYFGTASNTGAAADLATPCGDGVANIVKYAFHLDPTRAVSPAQLPRPALSGNYLELSFSQPAAVNGVIFGAEWSTSLEEESWHPVSDEGAGNAHLFRVPVQGEPRMFMRLRVAPLD